ncbi:TetR/AcrR family transcriptional regulator [Desulfobaculum bizertense]|uniref:Transcriptional regulator, TetR family n=1 Tax=Desulfobaculum bizertense DSM 18034 TaxID=1121442 RepID=A0A1T4VZ54_9BACT|nr:TetR/AcrR family transcriptional regulator [Desulfobaculum bizertense]UIJ36954.1 TetR/AcrR family transcriptional regulator [Desulfobaculum bizertense]SKA69761.1 transcriptional regulator, TetR family [Desulfobaculum bizertense DSM 18034]
MSYKGKILETAKELFATRGYKDTSIAEISRHSGAAEGTIFHHFRSKEEIYVSVLDHVKDEIVSKVEAGVAAKMYGNGLEMVLEYVSMFFRLSEQMHTEFRLLFRSHLYSLAGIHPALRKDVEEIYNCFVDILVEAIRKGLRDGSIKPDVSAEHRGLIIFSMMTGLLRFRMLNLFPVRAMYDDVLISCENMLNP